MIEIFNNVFLYFEDFSGCIIINVRDESSHQGIISFDSDDDGEYLLYMWYDEGEFPKEFDTIEQIIDGDGGLRLKITGVDVI
jgi:hypothetical protein